MAIAVVLIVGGMAVVQRLRGDGLDTWSGPDATVQSGIVLAGCALPEYQDNGVFPAWVRFDGRIYRWADVSAPISAASIGTSYKATDYHLNDLRIYRILTSAAARNGERILIRNGEADAGGVYVLVPDCH